jgi:Ca2+-binding RTX toxin-like protein
MRLPALPGVLGLLVAAVVPAVPAAADHIAGTSCKSCAGHDFWPEIRRADVRIAPAPDRDATLRGRPDRSNELLGAHGSDRLTGGDEADVIWGDHLPSGQPTGQWDRIEGGDGGDFIYSSHGRNTIDAGPGNDAIKVRYGRGVLNCGPGRDVVHVPRSRRRNWTFRNCERFEYRTEAEVGHGLRRIGDPATPPR